MAAFTGQSIVVVMPRFPYPEAGACEQDRAEGLRQLARLGFRVSVIAKAFDWQSRAEIAAIWNKEGVAVELVPYTYTKEPRWQKMLRTLFVPWHWDGAAAEFFDPAIQQALERRIIADHPALVWFEYTYLWPLYKIARKKDLPIIVRSINYEATHFLEEDGRSLVNYIKSVPKFITERITARAANLLFAITPNETALYRTLGATAETLPLRSLGKKIGTHTPRTSEQLNLFFAGSTYNVTHNRRALEFVMKEVAPRLESQFPGVFRVHIFGSKFPADLDAAVGPNVIKRGFVDDLDAAMAEMDIALAPSFFGAGMQQKIFEPLARGFPTITNARGLAGYDFNAGEVLCAETADEYVQAIVSLRSLERRQEFSRRAIKKSKTLFSEAMLDEQVAEALQKCLSK